jgi:hypothetical protein
MTTMNPSFTSNLTLAPARASAPSRAALWTGRVSSTLIALLLGLDALMKLLQIAPVIAGTTELGYDAHSVLPIGVVLAICVIAYVVPRTSLLGAVLLTGYLGGAVATHVRVGNPLLSHTLFPLYVAAVIWGGLVLRDARLRAFLKSWVTR